MALRQPYKRHPPGCYEQVMPHPAEEEREMPVGISHEHRFAFYFWSRWTSENQAESTRENPPDLVTIDWHRDLAPPPDPLKQKLKQLSLEDPDEIALFSWRELDPHNDGQVLSAAYKNLIGDIYVLCKQRFSNVDQIADVEGRPHRVHVHYEPRNMLQSIRDAETLYLDIDLDYFTETESFMGKDPDVKLENEERIRQFISPSSALFQTIFKKMRGFTIALEPEFCGGYRNSCFLYSLLDQQLFDPPLLHPSADWKFN